MTTITINGANVHVLNDNWHAGTLISLALDSDTFSIEHEKDADYGRMTIYTLDEGLRATIREIDEDQIEQIGKEKLGDIFGFAFVKTEDSRYDWRGEEEIIVRFWRIEAHEDEAYEDDASEAA